MRLAMLGRAVPYLPAAFFPVLFALLIIGAGQGAVRGPGVLNFTSTPSPTPLNYAHQVDTTADPGLSTCTAAPDDCSLRAAISNANANPGTDTITFNIGSGIQTIAPASALPQITDRVNIDGTTQPGFAGAPIVEINGLNAGAGVDGLHIAPNGAGSLIKGLVINRFGGDGIEFAVAGGGGFIQSSYIGTGTNVNTNLGNGGHGVNISAAEGIQGVGIGATGAGNGNVIRFNGGDGVSVQAGINHGIRNNVINSNAGTEIDLANDGPTANDGLGDADSGPNNLQNFPVIDYAVILFPNPSLQINGYLLSTPNATFILEFFATSFDSCSPDPGSEFFIGSSQVTSDATGYATFKSFFGAGMPNRVTATATGITGDAGTSEFADCVQVLLGEATPSPTPSPPGQTPTPTPTSTPPPTPTPSPSPTPTPMPVPPHDARIARIGSLTHNVRLAPGQTVEDEAKLIVANQSGHSETIGVYAYVIPPGDGHCLPAGRVLDTSVTLDAGSKTAVPLPLAFSCLEPALADGLHYAIKAFVDHGGDDFASCGTQLEAFNGVCSVALADDDDDDSDNSKTRALPIVIAVPGPTVTPTPTPTPTPGPPTFTSTPAGTQFDIITSFTFNNTTGQTASDLHFVVTTPGELIGANVGQNAPGCSSPSVSFGPASGGPDFTYAGDIVWPAACVDNAESVFVYVVGSAAAALQCFHWTIFAAPIGTECVPSCGGVPCCNGLPCPTPTPAPGFSRHAFRALSRHLALFR